MNKRYLRQRLQSFDSDEHNGWSGTLQHGQMGMKIMIQSDAGPAMGSSVAEDLDIFGVVQSNVHNMSRVPTILRQKHCRRRRQPLVEQYPLHATRSRTPSSTAAAA